MEGIRTLVQSKLLEIPSLSCGEAIPDGMVENGETYFGYEIQEIHLNGDFNNNYTMEVSLTGRLVRRKTLTENTTQIVDTALENIKEKLKELNFKYTYNDINTDNNFKKIYVKATVRYNELNNEFIV